MPNGYEKFSGTKPVLAIQHIRPRHYHRLLPNCMQLTYRLRKDAFESNFKLLVRKLAKKPEAIDHHESASGTSAGGFISKRDQGASPAGLQGNQSTYAQHSAMLRCGSSKGSADKAPGSKTLGQGHENCKRSAPPYLLS